MDRIKENEKEYIVYIGKKSMKYSKKRYKMFAKLLAEKSLKDKRKYQDFFKECKDFTIFYIVTQRYGIKKIKIDKEDAYKFYDRKISVSNDNHSKTFYGKTKDGSVHRIVMDYPNGIIDHINHNGLDNRKSNLRTVNTSINNKNSTIRTDSPLGIKGVTKEITKNGYIKYISTYRDENKKVVKHTFSSNKYGEENAFMMAVNDRLNAEEKYGYIKQECSETIEQVLQQIKNKSKICS